jgi:hypothetical protein
MQIIMKMKKRILAVAIVQISMLLVGCSGDSSEPQQEMTPTGIKADFITTYNNIGDFVIDDNNSVYTIDDKTFRKIDLDGKETILKNLDDSNLRKITLADNGNILLITAENFAETNKIYRFENNFTELNSFYTMKPISSPSASKIRLTSITKDDKNTYFVYDYNGKNMKRFLPDLATDVFVAGSGKEEVVDGAGLDAGFGSVIKMVFLNKAFYFIDIKNATSYIRKLEYVNDKWVVTTLTSTSTPNEFYKDIAIDSNNDLYVLVWGKGICKLNLLNNTMSTFMDALNVGVWVKNIKDNVNTYDQKTLDFKHINGFKFKNNDLYILTNQLIKVSDYKKKFNL